MPDFDICSFGAREDGPDNSAALGKALAAVKEAGGGVLRIGPGIWRTGPVEIFSHTTLVMEEGAVLSFIPEPERYTPVWSRWEGVECYCSHPLVFAVNQEDITIKGKGCFDGSGSVWWNLLREKRRRAQKEPESAQEKEFARLNENYKQQPSGGGGREIQFLRPPLVQFLRCSGIHIEGISLVNSPFWTIHQVFCQDIVLRELTISNPKDAPNTDGIDIDSCADVLIENCRVAVGDDGIVLKSGSGEEGVHGGNPTRNVTIRGCIIEEGHGGIVIGSETAAGVYGILAEHCFFKGTQRGIRIKTRRGRGGQIKDLEFRDLIMENNLCPFVVNMYYYCGAEDELGKPGGCFSPEQLPVNSLTPSIKNIHVSGIKARGCRASAGFIAGLPESPVENIRLADCSFSTDEVNGVSPTESDMFLGIPEVKERSFRFLNVKNTEFSGVTVSGPAEAFIYR